MMKYTGTIKKGINLTCLMILMLFPSVFSQNKKTDWREQFRKDLQLFGHRNWILIVDAAYPFQSKPAIKTIVTGEGQLEVVKTVLEAIDNSPHVYPEVFLDKEIDYVSEEAAPGMEAYKMQLGKLLEGLHVDKMLHEALIAKIDEAAKTFHILVLKTNMIIPYTSVFLRLNCGYWNTEQEQQMRRKMKQ